MLLATLAAPQTPQFSYSLVHSCSLPTVGPSPCLPLVDHITQVHLAFRVSWSPLLPVSRLIPRSVAGVATDPRFVVFFTPVSRSRWNLVCLLWIPASLESSCYSGGRFAPVFLWVPACDSPTQSPGQASLTPLLLTPRPASPPSPRAPTRWTQLLTRWGWLLCRQISSLLWNS